MENTPENYELEYVKFLEENNIKETQLPTQIRKQIGTLKAAWGRYNKKPTPAMKNNVVKQDVYVSDLIADYIEQGIEEQEEEKQAELLAEREGKIKDLVNFISADETINYKTASDEEFNKLLEKLTKAKADYEKKLTDEQAKREEEHKNNKEEVEKGKNNTPPNDNHPKETPNTQTPPPSNNGIRPEVQAMVVKIKEKLAANNNIISTKDLKAIINRPPAEPTQQVGDVKLRKVFLRSEYKLVQ